MLAIAFALALSSSGATQLALHEPAETAVVAPIIPHGWADGAWVAPTQFQDGIVTALLEDSTGNPLWVLDARLTKSGSLHGRLLPLEYATNPALAMPVFAIAGQALFAPDGSGVFSASIYSPYIGDIPIYPFGKLEGRLISALDPLAKPGLAGSSAAPGANQLAARAADVARQSANDVAGKSGAASGAQAQDRADLPADLSTGMIVCPKGPDFFLAGKTSAGKHGLYGGQKLGSMGSGNELASDTVSGHQVKPIMVVCPAGQGASTGGVSVKAIGQVEHTVPMAGGGPVRASWYLLP